jgi:predicted transcriptional regulator
MPNPPDIAPAEWKVMRLLWRRAPLPAADIIQALAAREDWHPNTIKTLLARLVRKRALGARRHQGRFHYRPFVRSQTLEFWHARLKSLGHVARFRARHHLEHHRPGEAAADLLATWVLGRHLPKTEMHFSVLVGISIEAVLDGFVAEHFHLFDDTALRQLARGIQSLPDPGPLPDWIERRQPPPTDTDASPVDPKVEAAARAAVARAHHLNLTIAVRRQMILAAINYRLAGLTEFERIRDPAGSGPFQIRRVVVEGVDRGFSLESALDRGLRNEKLVFIEQPGPFLYVDGPRAGEMRPPEQDLEGLMRQRYGVEPGVVVPPLDETTPGDPEVEADNLDEARRRASHGKLLYEMGKQRDTPITELSC